MSDTLTLYKLILLHILDKVSFPMSNGQLSEFMPVSYTHLSFLFALLYESRPKKASIFLQNIIVRIFVNPGSEVR